MCRVLLTLLVFLSSANCLTMFGLPNVVNLQVTHGVPVPLSFFNGLYSPTYIWREQIDKENKAVYGKNFSFIPSPDVYGCVPMLPATVYTNKITTGFSLGSNRCGYGAMSQYCAQGGCAGVMIAMPVPMVAASVPWIVQADPNGPPVFTWANLNSDAPLPQQVPLSFIALFSTLMGLANITMQMDFPEQNPLFTAFYTLGTAESFMYWTGQMLSIFAMLIVSSKLAIYVSHGLWRSMAGYTLAFALFGSMTTFLLSYGGTAGWAPAAMADIQFFGFFELWPFTCVATCLMLIGLYYSEVATLTSAASTAGLERFKWPAIVLIAIVWVACFALSFIVEFLKTPDIPPPTGGSYGIAVAVIWGLIAATSLGMVAVGSILLLRSMQQKVSLILPFLLLSAFCTLNYCWGLAVFIQCRYFIDTVTLWNEYQWVMLMSGCTIWQNSITFIGFSFMFRVRLQKEIEISKSATSSTSGTMSSKSSSSSSSQQDPVIEL